MDKLEQYLDQVCRGLGGSRAMRQHVRQELREHLRDAIAEHRAAGMPENDALARALQDFGGPEQVKSELEATHGQRLMAVVIDKAIQWKEKTMKAKWLWTTWAHLALAIVVAMEVLYLSFTKIFIVPKFQKIVEDSFLPGTTENPETAWLFDCLQPLVWMAIHATWLLLATLVLWGLFEWRVRSEHKTFMRLAALGTAAIGLMVTVVLTTGSMLLLFMLGLPGGILVGPRMVNDLTAGIDASVSALEQSAQKKDWEAIEAHANRVSHALGTLSFLESQQKKFALQSKKAIPGLWTHVKSATEKAHELEQSGQAKDSARLEAALKRFRQEYAPVREWAAGLVK